MGANGIMGETTMQRKYRSKYENPRPKSNLQAAKDFILRVLADGPVPSKEVYEKADAEGVLPTYVKQAKRELTTKKLVCADRIDGSVNEWTWRLTDESERPQAATVGKEGTIDLQRTHHTHEDEFSITMEERKRLGIRDNEQVTWQLDPGYWKGKVPGDPIRMFIRNNAGGRVIYDPETKDFVGNGIDTILCVRPMEEVEKLRAREQAEANRIDRQNTHARDDDFDNQSEDRLRARMHQNSIEHQRAGLIGQHSPSSGMAYEDYVRNRGLSKADIEAEELRYSLRGTTSREVSEEEYAEAIASNRRAGARGGNREGGGQGGGKFYSLPQNIRPRNLASR